MKEPRTGVGYHNDCYLEAPCRLQTISLATIDRINPIGMKLRPASKGNGAMSVSDDVTVGRKLIRVTEAQIELAIFRTRWLLAPAYLVLCGCLAVLCYKTLEEFYELLTRLVRFAEVTTIVQVLNIVDLVLIMNLVLMVLFVGYVNFVSKIHPKEERKEDWPKWMGFLDYSGLKVQLMGSVIAVSSVKLLRVFEGLFEGGEVDGNRIFWMIVLQSIFLGSALAIAIVNKLKVPADHARFDDG
jgi:uncharacterized protein (TIGR00645 family)